VGRAVHATLAQVDLATGRDPAGRPADEVARALALVHGVAAHGGDVSTMVDSALTSPVVQRAGTRRHWREVYVATPVAAGGVLEGFVDLLFEDDDGLVVVDYKTHAPDGSTDVADIAAYRQQVAAYALALEASTGRPVVRCVLLFIGHARPVELVVDGHDLDAARMEARRVAEIIVTGDRADSALERSR
jgi:ATP-dependent helicase/nuclease subunit A